MKKSNCLGMECGYCRARCPAFTAVPLESSTARGKARILEAYRKGELEAGELVEASYICARCGYCDEICPVGAGSSEFLLEMRQMTVDEGDIPPELTGIIERLDVTGTPYGERDTGWADSSASKGTGKPRKKRSFFSKGRGRTAYFPGCTVQAKTPDIAARTMELLHLCGEDPVPIPGPCCGSPYMNAGLKDKWETAARDLLEFFNEKRIGKIIVSCPGCARAFGEDYPGIPGKDATAAMPGIVHITTFLTEVLRKQSLPFRKMKGRAIYHDPCHLGRTLGVIEEPRRLIRAAGLELVEFHAHGRESECCGGGGVLQVYRKEESRRALEKRAMEAVDRDVDFIISACGHCEARFRSFVEVNPDKCGKMEVLNVVDLFDTGGGDR